MSNFHFPSSAKSSLSTDPPQKPTSPFPRPMRIRGRKPLSPSSPDHSVSPSSSSSVSSSSSITLANSSLSSSQDSSNSFPLQFATSHRCHGLDLLVKAIYQVNAGSVIGVPYIQRRVTIRRRRRELLCIFTALFEQQNRKGVEKKKQNKKRKGGKKKICSW